MTPVRIIKRADDPAGLSRVSVGAGPKFGFVYCVYRGKRDDAIECLELAIEGLRAARSDDRAEPAVTPEKNGRVIHA